MCEEFNDHALILPMAVLSRKAERLQKKCPRAPSMNHLPANREAIVAGIPKLPEGAVVKIYQVIRIQDR